MPYLRIHLQGSKTIQPPGTLPELQKYAYWKPYLSDPLVFPRGFAPIGMLEYRNIGKMGLGYWKVGLMVKFVISPEYSGYWEKILAYWDIAKKFAFPRLQYYIGCYLHNCINCTFSPKMVLRRFSTCNPKMGRGNRIRLNKSGMWSWNITLVLENDNG